MSRQIILKYDFRSIGDTIGSEIGVIGVPLVTYHKIISNDQFIVICSDGVWDVMSNEEVVNFVEKYRRQSQRMKPAKKISGNKLKGNLMTISQLLCEEARFRWFKIVENEDVMIDDISAIILEFDNISSLENKDVNKQEKLQQTIFDLYQSKENEDLHQTLLKRMNDPKQQALELHKINDIAPQLQESEQNSPNENTQLQKLKTQAQDQNEKIDHKRGSVLLQQTPNIQQSQNGKELNQSSS